MASKLMMTSELIPLRLNELLDFVRLYHSARPVYSFSILSLNSIAPLAHDQTNDESTNCTQNENWSISLCDNGIRQAKKYAENQTISPTRYGKTSCANNKADGEAIKE